MRPEELAAELGVSGKTVRAWLRKRYPRDGEGKHKPWYLTGAQAEAVRARFAKRRTRAESRERMVVTTVALPIGLHQRLAAAARQEHTVMTEVLRRALKDWLVRRRETSRKEAEQ